MPLARKIVATIACSAAVAAGLLSAEAAAQESSATVRIPGEATTSLTTDGKPAANAGLGFEYETEGAYARLRFNLGVAGFALDNAEPRAYANLLLQPDSQGFTFALDATKLWGGGDSDWSYGVGGIMRVSPTMTWKIDESVIDVATNEPTITTFSGDVTTGALLLGGAVAWRVSPLDELPIRVGLTGGVSLRGLIGDVDDGLLVRAIGTTSRLFMGGELRLQVHVRDVAVFARTPFLWSTSGGGDVQGLTGFRFLAGLEVNGKIFEKDLTARPAPPGLLETPPPPPKPPTPRLAL